MSLLDELKRRKVFKVGAAYLVVGWLLIEVAATVLPQLNFPEWAPRMITFVILLGFPVTLVMAWMLEVTPDGVRVEAWQSGSKRMIAVAVVLAVLALGWYFRGRSVTPLVETANNTPPVQVDAVQASVAAEPTSIAVLPFTDMSQAHDQEYFSDGLSEELLNQLAQIPQLRVIARTSSFSFKGKDVAVSEIAKALNVSHVLEGSVRKSGDTLRITAQLVRTSDSSHLWSQTYDRKLTDIFKVQDEISNQVVAALKLKLLPDQALGTTQRTTNVEAYNQFLLGLEYTQRYTKQSVLRSIAAIERAIALDPNYANAYARLAYLKKGMADFAETPAQRDEMIRQAFASADKAIALAPDLSMAYGTRAEARFRIGSDWKGAEDDFRRALALDPNNVNALSAFALEQFFAGHQAEAIAMDRRAVVMDPLSANAWTYLGVHLAFSGQSAEARPALQRSLDIVPESVWPRFLLGYLDLKEGKTDSALAHFQVTFEPLGLAGIAMVEFTRGHERESLQALEALKSKYEVGFAYQIAEAYGWRGDKDQAIHWLERAYELNDAGLFRMRYDPMLALARDDPRFKALAKKVGIPE